ncbi:MAG TPA: tRNA (adenosine(37)-N6)-threonylcarbamoyltransferase complex ATPase subunit type 1 TsaE [Kouleothrix sp.]|uniref:tRNA (adenosine(37)-N6)-threonylcarbamoyltransferase complex ATPase subunit type 1 TsaE n=1 Tax=Kouleothrix sp. TaxID=2779161 RepID=UPI002C6D6F12|nr:tRNA (adenosine(37)-N6)-threonylcarbamoyltransferase complex ATPase subunit type 1 TsaE [Kouleothrix sp.]
MKSISHAVQSQHVLDCISHNVAQTLRYGQRLGELLRPGDLLLLLGDFGAGKTHLIKGIAQGLGSDDMVNSPSFVLINEYRAGAQHGRMPIFHADLYRIEDPDELTGIGLEEAWAGDGVCLIEWAEQAGGRLPQEHLAIYLQHLAETKRTLRLVPHGARYEALVAEFKKTAFA